MKKIKKMKECFTIALLAIAAAPSALAADSVRLLDETKVSLSQAIDAAQKYNGSRAIEASLDDDSFKPSYEVSVVKDGRIFDVQVDGVTGEILGAREDIDD